MAQLDALQLSEKIRQRLTDFCVDDNFVNDPKLADICRELWSSTPQNGGLLSDLWIEGNFPAEQSDWTLAKLVNAGRFNTQLCDQLDKTKAVPSERPLYTHQYEALCCAEDLEKQVEKPAIVVTAGTGAGKTEAFLLPILNALYTSPTEQEGVKCIILYPMNALVNDQVDRLYSWLEGQTHVRLFHFTSETPENKSFADRNGIPNWDSCRVRTRQEARGLENPKTGRKQNPSNLDQIPDILVTNYSMLEYMLCRPQDSVFFGSGLRAVVIDEAHLYTGTLAAEIALLLRRLAIRCGVSSSDILQMATSATLGSGNLDDLKRFAATIFSKSIDQVRVIEGRSTRVQLDRPAPPKRNSTPEDLTKQNWLDRPLMTYDEDMQPILAKDPDMCQKLRQQLPVLVNSALVDSVKEQEVPARLIKETLRATPLIHELEKKLWEHRHLPLRELAEKLWEGQTEDAIKATIVLLQLAASARTLPQEYPLVPHRIHLMARSNDGLSVCVNSNCSGEQHLKLNALGCVLSGFHEACSCCGGAVLSLFRCRNCGEWLLAGEQGQQYLKPVISDGARATLFFSTRATPNSRKYVIDPMTAELKGTTDNAVSLYQISECPRCGESQQAFTSFLGWSPLLLSILTETVLSEMPHFPTPLNNFLPAQGRRLLVFSDSRQEAARLGPRLTVQHELQVIRAAILKQIVEEPLGGEKTVAGIKEMIRNHEMQLAEPDLVPGLRQVIENILHSLRLQAQSAAAGGSIDDWCKKLAHQSFLYELLDRETASSHSYKKRDGKIWGQREWEDNHKKVQHHARLYLAHEFARTYRGRNALENLGLIEVTYPGIDELQVPNTLLGILPHEKAQTQLSRIWEDLLKALCDTLRADGVITLEDSDVLKDSPFNVPYIGYWCAEQASGNRLVSFVGQSLKQRRLWFADQVLRSCGVSDGIEDLAKQTLRMAFEQLMTAAHPVGQKPSDGQLSWLQCHIRQSGTGPTQDAIQLVFDHLGLQRPVNIYRCEKTGHLWYRSILGCAPEIGCDRTLSPISDDELDKDARVGRQRREYRNSKVFHMGLWAEEHSAQLSPHENRRLQDLFKYGIRNILSATTTLELGIDIGGLNAVLMSNVPPGKANYLQRAGRAGRRSDGTSAVITYARPQPYDREVFYRIGDYLERPLRKPLVFLDRNRVVRRHFHSFLLGEFFRAIYPEDQHVGAMNAFGNMGTFCGVTKVEYWEKGELKPRVQTSSASEYRLDFPWWNPDLKVPGLEAQFLNYLKWIRDRGQEVFGNTIKTLLNETRLLKEIEDWHSFLQDSINHFHDAIRSWREEYENLLSSWQATGEEQQAQANAIRYQLSALHAITVIEGLADRQFLPHYGFPIGVQKLRVIAPDQEYQNKICEEDQYRLERSSLLALREYVPGSQLLVGGKLISSRGLLKHWTDGDRSFGLRGQWCECIKGHFYYWISKMEPVCPICSSKSAIPPMPMLFPKHGFSSAAWDPPKFSTDVERIGSVETATMTFLQNRDEEITAIKNLGDIQGLACHYQEDGEILVYNNGENDQGFAICLKCGFAESETDYGEGSLNLPADFVNHAPLHSANPWMRCWADGESHILRRQMLAAREITDVLMVNFMGCPDFPVQDHALLTTLGYALQRAGVQILELDMREIGVMTVPTGGDGSGWGIVLYDNVAGGTGHVRELLGLGRLWLEEALRILYVNSDHHDRCETACLDCLLGIDAQIAVSRGLLKRKQAHQVLDLLLKRSPLPQQDKASKQENYSSENIRTETSKTDAEIDPRDLLRKAQERIKRRR